MNSINIIKEYKQLMKLYYPNLYQTSQQVYKENFKPYKKQRFYKQNVKSIKFNNFKLLTQPINCWTKSEVLEAQKVVKYLKTKKPKLVSNKLQMKYKKPLFWSR